MRSQFLFYIFWVVYTNYCDSELSIVFPGTKFSLTRSLWMM